ncbi:hypothetical protein NP233_g8070 [Leucocoprinus birnbaumii]|uniref:Uncharacterized protein n=1 Tax=Leucocoprinus birnbaumii TaxID=56174 RepID=A0AAD5VQQ1_9AGAR|nr:hypothetical protein NP233_g8070 [Leucocoprinus birnbaumii]
MPISPTPAATVQSPAMPLQPGRYRITSSIPGRTLRVGCDQFPAPAKPLFTGAPVQVWNIKSTEEGLYRFTIQDRSTAIDVRTQTVVLANNRPTTNWRIVSVEDEYDEDL